MKKVNSILLILVVLLLFATAFFGLFARMNDAYGLSVSDEPSMGNIACDEIVSSSDMYSGVTSQVCIRTMILPEAASSVGHASFIRISLSVAYSPFASFGVNNLSPSVSLMILSSSIA